MVPPLSTVVHRLIIITCLITHALAEWPAFMPEDTENYETGKWGWYPETKFRSTDVVAPRPLHRVWGPQCRTHEKFIIAPRGFLVGHPGPLMLDDQGQMVWHDLSFRGKMSYGATVQTYRRKQYLTFWTGYDMDHGHGSGHYYMFDENYRQAKKISAPYNWTGDLHEFAITRDDTALFTSYVKTKVDLTPFGGRKDGWIYDGTFQELDVESKEVLFEWRASQHIGLGECYWPLPTGTPSAGSYDDPWDYYHINSVEKDNKGNFLISSRYAHAVTYINGKNGKIIWYLGGKNNSFTDLSNGTATNFMWQHDARWTDDHTAITLFDNRAFTGGDGWNQPPARGLKIKLNFAEMTATKEVELNHPLGYISVSQGSMQKLPNGNYLMGYGSAAGMTEFYPNGSIACDTSYGAMFATEEKNFGAGSVMSYRAFRQPWVGKPFYEPDVAFEDENMYVSWNGATEVRQWLLEGTNNDEPTDEQWNLIGRAPRQGFETQIPVGPMAYKVFRLTALDKDMRPEGMWRVFSGGVVQPVQMHEKEQDWLKNIMFIAIGALVASIGMWLFQRQSKIRSNLSAWTRDPSAAWSNFKPRWAGGSSNATTTWKAKSTRSRDVERYALVKQDEEGQGNWKDYHDGSEEFDFEKAALKSHQRMEDIDSAPGGRESVEIMNGHGNELRPRRNTAENLSDISGRSSG